MTMQAHETRPRNEAPVRVVGAARFRVATERGAGTVPLFTGGASDGAKVERVVIMLHGRLRDADAYLRTAEHALAASSIDPRGTLLVVPQFVATADVEHHALEDDLLHWEWTAWMGGLDARGPCALSSFDVLDALVAAYARDRARLPMLREIVIAGHSGGAQVAHRYAIAGKAASADNVKLRYVIANPSSYVYFDASRPGAPCDEANDWKYGLDRLPRYACGRSASVMESRYVQSEVIYLLGELDCDPAHPALDRSCAANAQGPHRLARGRAYYAYLLARHPRLRHRLDEVPGAGHSGEAMFVSEQGVRALFGDGTRLVRSAAIDAGGASE
ncbi:hypothetical protein [Caballeronia ptereochthonis]|uniref:Alpha/beta hydrolase family protein n=1 Tax=Caballeronia ptereochthonis TaxID=1777144 RepID=A0A158CE16_9BURK|nr:hypothetical protein [Caballeronia ptereochthonis]SAK80585.1 hypothetical protein AWB83_04259 [Caballeronia ptereochthonis]